MGRLESTLCLIDNALDTIRRRHLMGGLLISISLLFGGLAVTVITLKMEDKEHE